MKKGEVLGLCRKKTFKVSRRKNSFAEHSAFSPAMLSKPSPVVFRKLSPALCIGGSIGVKNAKQDCSVSHMHLPVLVSHFITNDVCKPVQLYNTRCKYYETDGGCTKGWRCPFLHNEKPFDDCVFLNGKEPIRFRTQRQLFASHALLSTRRLLSTRKRPTTRRHWSPSRLVRSATRAFTLATSRPTA